MTTEPSTVERVAVQPSQRGEVRPRDLTVDALRAVAIVAVAVGHWLVVVPSYAHGRFGGVNALETVALMRSLSWIFQVMPLFFVCGGVANAASWRSASNRGMTYAEWLRGRLDRLMRPTAVLFAVWAGIAAGARGLGVDADLVHTLAWLVVVPVWFLAVYVVVVAAVPAQVRAHDRFGALVLVVLAAGAVIVDGLRIGGGLGAVGYLNFFFVFLFSQQLGFWWYEDRLPQARRTQLLLFVGSLSALWFLTHAGPYPVSMVGVPGEEIANNAPPTIALLVLGLAQVGLALLVRPALLRVIGRSSIQKAAAVLNRYAMTILLWHFTALVLAALVILPLGVMPDDAEGSGSWWLVRLATVVVLSVPLAGLVAIFGRVERSGGGARSSAGRGRALLDGREAVARGPVGVVLAAAAIAVACALVTVHGLNTGDARWGVPVAPMALFGVGAWWVRR